MGKNVKRETKHSIYTRLLRTVFKDEISKNWQSEKKDKILNMRSKTTKEDCKSPEVKK